jgi:uncharacterized membrane protein YfhO
MKRKYKKYLAYTLLYWIFAIYILQRSAQGGYVTIGTSDPIAQHYPVMIYIGRMMKNFIYAIFHHQKFVFPMVDWTVGMGENTIASLNYYGLGDVFYCLTAFVSEDNMPYFFSFLLYLRIFLGGVAFIAMCNEINPNKSTFSYVVGAFSYCFSGFALACNMHIIFVHAMMYIPLMILGSERTLNGKKRFVLTLTVFFFAMTGFYYLYIGSIALGFFTIWRSIEKKKNKFMSIILEYIVGICLSSVIFIPSIIGVFNSNRIGRVEASIFLTLRECLAIIEGIQLPYGEQMLSMSAIALISIMWTFFDKTKKIQKINIILLLITAVMPIISLVMSGFGVIYERWEIVIILYFAYIVFDEWDDIFTLNIWQKIITVVALVVWTLYGKRKDLLGVKSFQYIIIFYVFMAVVVWLGYILKKYERYINICNIVISIIVVAMMCRDWNLIARDRPLELLEEDDVVSDLIDDDDFYRVEYEKTFGEPRYGMNLSLRQGFNGISAYLSIESINYINAFEKWGASYASFNNGGLDQRTVLETLAGVKYYIGRKDNTMIVPYGFEKTDETSDGEWILYENKYALPIVYMYDYVYSQADAEELSGYDMQEIMTQAAIIPGYSGNVQDIISWNNDNQEAEYNIVESENVTFNDGIIHVENGSTMKLAILYRNDCEYYLTFNDNISVIVDLDDGYEKYKVPVNIGNTSDEGIKILDITFGGQYDINQDDMQVIEHSFSNYESEIDNLREGVTSYEIGTNKVKCTVDVDNDKILCLAAPFIDGWKVYIDGEEAKIELVNSLYMGVSVTEGEHEIVFKYVTPGLKVGMIISCSTLIVIIILSIKQLCFVHKKKVILNKDKLCEK